MSTVIQEDCVGINLAIAVKQPSGQPLDLTGVGDITFRITDPSGLTQEFAGAILGLSTLGMVSYANASTVLDLKGTYRYQAKITWPDGRVFWTAINKIKVKENLPQP